MKEHFQTDTESIYDHGLNVWKYTKKLIAGDISDMRVPQWFGEYKDRILNSLPNLQIIENYCIFHDLGKCYSLTIDETGKRHFPNHEIVSQQKWLEISNDISDRDIIANLIRYDMLFHKEKPEEIIKLKLPTPILCTLLLSALGAIHANADSFGGMQSDSFKIKAKNLDKRAKVILSKIFDHQYMYVLVRNDLSPSQICVQSCHAVIEATRNFNMNGEHPSVILCVVKSEEKLKQVSRELATKGIRFSSFFEPDIGNKLTAIASAPVSGVNRDVFKRFQLL